MTRVPATEVLIARWHMHCDIRALHAVLIQGGADGSTPRDHPGPQDRPLRSVWHTDGCCEIEGSLGLAGTELWLLEPRGGTGIDVTWRREWPLAAIAASGLQRGLRALRRSLRWWRMRRRIRALAHTLGCVVSAPDCWSCIPD